MPYATQLPDVSRPASTGQTFSRESFVGKVPLVLASLPTFAAPADVDEIAAFDAQLLRFGRERAILGVVRETTSVIRDFASERSSKVPRPAEPGAILHRAVGLPGEVR